MGLERVEEQSRALARMEPWQRPPSFVLCPGRAAGPNPWLECGEVWIDADWAGVQELGNEAQRRLGGDSQSLTSGPVGNAKSARTTSVESDTARHKVSGTTQGYLPSRGNRRVLTRYLQNRQERARENGDTEI